jgi:hypothetical protein
MTTTLVSCLPTARRLSGLALLIAAAALTGCATPQPHDYTAFQRAKPTTLLVMPPVSDAPDIKASPAVWAHATAPLSEAGYYVLPITLVDEMLRENGVQTPADAQEIALPKLREVFQADAAVYLKVLRYGTSYSVIDSQTVVDVEGRIVDLRDGSLLWSGRAQASSAEQQQQNQGGLAGLLIAAALKQIIGTSTDAAYGYAATAQQRLLGAPRQAGVLPGPRSPLYGQVPGAPR